LTLSVRYDDEGRLQWIRALDFRPDQARVPTLVAVLERALRDDFRANWGVRLRIAGDGEVVDVLPSVLCEPKLETYASMPFRPLGTQWEIQDYENARGRWHEVLVSLDELGRAGSVRMARSSMSRIMDEEILALARTAHYSPKLHDGIPVATIFGLKVRAPRRRD
jgi:TonB family protein